MFQTCKNTCTRCLRISQILLSGISNSLKLQAQWMHVFSKIQIVVYYQCCVLIGWATARLYVIAHQWRKAPLYLSCFGGKKGLKCSFDWRKIPVSIFSWPTNWILIINFLEIDFVIKTNHKNAQRFELRKLGRNVVYFLWLVLIGSTETIIPLTLKASGSMAHSAFGLVDFRLKAHSSSRNSYLLLKTESLDNAIQDFLLA